MNVLISGGCKNGKSFFAQEEARRQAEEAGMPMYYVATMIPVDEEDRQRIKRHVKERDGWGFTTLEQGRGIRAILENADSKGVFLLDSVTALLSNEMFGPDGNTDRDAAGRVADDLVYLAQKTGSMIFVSDYIYSDACLYDAYTNAYREGLAFIDKALARECDRVIEVAYGSRYEFK